MEQSDRQLIVVGSSAGGIEALSTLVAGLPEDFPSPVVIAQHMDPNRPSRLGDILAARTRLPVVTVRDRSAMEPGTIYVTPPDRHVEITDGHVQVLPDGDPRPKPSINALLASAAKTYGERLIAVILTGSGSDGASGAVIVKEDGGTVVIQDPQTAAYPSMPRSLPPSVIDFNEPIERIGPLLTRLCQVSAHLDPESDEGLSRLLDEIRSRQGIDFNAYKTQTLVRRLGRRLIATSSPNVESYRAYLRAHPDEERVLISNFLIKVTRFFRDTALFEYLRTDVLPELIDEAMSQGRELRIWSAGCATGEEPYSLALLVADLIGRSNPIGVRIFATDLDENAIAFGRRGIYSPTALAGVPKDLVDRFFTPVEEGFEVRPQVRGMVVFGQHDLGQRPPFPNIDLVLCRNVLIYFTSGLQQQALEAFAYSIRDGGYLALGSSETPRPLDDLFDTHDRRHRVYRRQGARPPLHPARSTPSTPWTEPTGWLPQTHRVAELVNHRAERDAPLIQQFGGRFEKILRQLESGVALIDRRYDIVFINGTARRLLGIHGIAVGQDFIHLSQRVPSTALRAAIDAVLRGDGPVHLDRIIATESATGDVINLDVSCQAEQIEKNGAVSHVLIVVNDVTGVAQDELNTAVTVDRLTQDNQSLRHTIERLTQGNRELLHANRELSDTADDLREQSEDLRLAYMAAQVAAEEIETLNEELQATNEELETLNEETQATLEELNATNDELSARSVELEDLAETHAAERARLSAILGSIGEAVVVVDATGRVIQSNPAYDALVESLGGKIDPTGLFGDVLASEAAPRQRAASGERFQMEFTVADGSDGPRWFEVTGSPLRGDNRVGGVLVIRETTDRRLRRLEEQFLHIAGHELRSPLTALQGYLQLARRRVDGLDDGRLSRYIDAAIQQVQRQSQLINQLMEVGRLRTGKLALDLEPVDIVALVEGGVETMRVIAPDRTFTVESDPASLEIQGDPLRLEQILLNLLSNAVKHAPDSQRIEVRLRLVAEEAVIEVQDDGPGIAPQNRQGIFDLLSQVERTDHSDQSGLGLGLYIAREIAQAHGGAISVISHVGDGSTFVVRLPVTPPAPVAVR